MQEGEDRDWRNALYTSDDSREVHFDSVEQGERESLRLVVVWKKGVVGLAVDIYTHNRGKEKGGGFCGGRFEILLLYFLRVMVKVGLFRPLVPFLTL